MNDDTLVFPEIDVDAADMRPSPIVVIPPAPPSTLKDTALASFAPIEAHMRTLAARYRDVAYDVTTPKGMKDAKAARLVLREEGRFAVQRLVKRLKDEANDLKRTLDARGDEVIALTKPVEDAIHSQIEAEEQRIEAERAEKARIEAERVQALQAKLAGLSTWIERCREPGMTPERIQTGIRLLTDLELAPDDWQEFHARALVRKDEVLEVMRELHRQAVAREQEAAETERLRLLAEQQAAELAELRRREAERQAQELAAARAESERLEAIAEANRKALQTITTPPGSAGDQVDGCRAPESQPDGCSGPVPQDQTSLPASPESEGRDSQQVLKAEPATADATDRDAPADASPRVGAMGAGQAADAAPAAEPTIKLGDICAWLGFTLTAAFVTDTLGVKPAGTDKRAVLFTPLQREQIRRKLLEHIEELR